MHEKLHQHFWGTRPDEHEPGAEERQRRHHRPPFGPGPGPRGHRMGPRFLWAAGMGRRQQVRRGDVRTAILALLAEKPMHGYQVMQELANRSGGAWAPSAGSIYPTLQQLEDEGLVHGTEQDGRRVFSLTETGREQAAKAAGSEPWNVDEADGQDARAVFMQLAQAAMQVYQVGNAVQLAEARRILVNARRELYGLLARDDQATSASGAASSDEAASDDEPASSAGIRPA